jgi:hypothetical protein
VVSLTRIQYLVVPAKAGIQTTAARHARECLDPGLRRGDETGYSSGKIGFHSYAGSGAPKRASIVSSMSNTHAKIKMRERKGENTIA